MAFQSEIFVDHPDVHMARDRAALPHAVASKGRQVHGSFAPQQTPKRIERAFAKGSREALCK